MKNQILDSPLHYFFSDFLKKGETIIWEGQPSLQSDAAFDSNTDDYNNYDRYAITSSFIIGFVFLYFSKDTPYVGWFFFIALIILTAILPAWIRTKKKSYNYAVTQNQILFHYKKKLVWKKDFLCYSIF